MRKTPQNGFTNIDDVSLTTLTRGQNTPLLNRSSATPHFTLPLRELLVFLRRDLRHKADYFANPF